MAGFRFLLAFWDSRSFFGGVHHRVWVYKRMVYMFVPLSLAEDLFFALVLIVIRR